jgi:hypothetical protein
MEVISETYECRAIGRTVPLRVLIERVSGIGEDEEAIVELQRSCRLGPRCPRLKECPLRADEV